MLELKNITKDYLANENMVHALKGINLQFRKSELVSILGPSGCGKTTMLNIIGGLDRYTDGDLIINGRSTKEFKDRDWDAYRNHSIGFVFQSYNLIPHQTVLQNVELALTLSGVSKSERKKRAQKALEDVGLGEQLHKRPSEMSGGQMQRVAIARALVNDPDIILADEPTGALDTKTGVRIMEILKNVAKDRLVIMVTHNPELAEEYSTRIVRMLDGKVIDDSMPLTEKELQMEELSDKTIQEEQKATGRKKKPSMSLATSFSLSLKNLFTKKGRTMLTSFAGSIGIIGIALIYAISQGMTTYIDTIQEETLSSYPLTIEKNNTDLSAIMETFMNLQNGDSSHEKDAVYQRSAVYEIIKAFNSNEEQQNDLKSFKSYIDQQCINEESEFGKAVNGVHYTYDLNLQVYTRNVDGKIIRSDAQQLMADLISERMSVDMNSFSQMQGSSPMMNGGMMQNNMSVWQEMLPGENGKPVSELIEKQYDVIYGSMPNSYNEIVLVVDKNNELNDMALYALGLEPKERIDEIMSAAMEGTELEASADMKWDYEDICSMEYRTVLNSDCYSYDSETGLYHDLRSSDTGLTYLYDNGIPLKVTGIIRPKEDAAGQMLTGSIGYTSQLTEYIINHSAESDIVKSQKESPDKDIISGLIFKSASSNMTDAEKKENFSKYINNLDNEEKLAAYSEMICIPTEEAVEQGIANTIKGLKREEMENVLVQVLAEQMSMNDKDISDYLGKMEDDEITEMYSMIVSEQFKAQYAENAKIKLSKMESKEMAADLKNLMNNLTDKQGAVYYDELIEFSDSTYEENLIGMGCLELDEPASINLYASSFENKDVITDTIEEYNKGKDEFEQIKYTDYIGLMMSSITTIINAITYVLIAFVSISLIVSSIMIGVITLISVQERTKEIGILRAIGASKKNVRSMFNAETMLIGLSSGLLGVVITYLLCIPINTIIEHLTGITNLKAFLPLPASIILIAISVCLTLISGFIPSGSAAKKDPVVALRTE